MNENGFKYFRDDCDKLRNERDDDMKCTVLIENTTGCEELMCEHGLSLFIETQNHCILFDTGQSGQFIHNAEALNLDLSKVDTVVISHGHYDHGGGLRDFLKTNGDASVFLHKNAFKKYYHGSDKYIGLDERLKSHPQIQLISSHTLINPTISIVCLADKQESVPVLAYGLSELKENKHIADRFDHETALLIEEKGKRILFSGCAHKGILNLMHWFHPDIFIGGFHLKQLHPVEQRYELLEIAKELSKYPAVYYTGHCTGAKQFNVLKEVMGDQLHAITTGTRIES